MRAVASGVLAMLAALAVVADAQPAADLERAKELYRSAEAAMKEARYDDAVRDYGAAYELAKESKGQTLYILDEPTTGLHFADTEALVRVLHRLVDRGNTIVTIEHNLDIIREADWIVDLGPEGGAGGGRLVAEGSPEAIAASPESHTGRCLRDLLRPSSAA